MKYLLLMLTTLVLASCSLKSTEDLSSVAPSLTPIPSSTAAPTKSTDLTIISTDGPMNTPTARALPSPTALCVPLEIVDSSIEQEIIEVIFAHLNECCKEVVISYNPSLHEFDLEVMKEWALMDWESIEIFIPGVTREQFTSLLLRNGSHQRNLFDLDLPYEYETITTEEIEILFSGGTESGWEAFEFTYPSASGYWSYSRIGIDCEESSALVFIRHRYGYAGMTGTFYLLQLNDGAWTIEEEFLYSES